MPTFHVYADGNIAADDVSSVLKSAKDLQSLSSYVTLGQHGITEDEHVLASLFHQYRESSMLMFPYEPNIEAGIDHGLFSTDAEYGNRRVDRYTLDLEPVKETDHPREALRFGLATSRELKLPSSMVGRYFKQNGDLETVIFGFDYLTVSLLADVDILSDSALEGKFKEILLDIAEHESFGQVSQGIIEMILVEWLMTAGEGEDNVFDELTKILSAGEDFSNEFIYRGGLDNIPPSDIRDIIEDDLEKMIMEISDSLEDWDIDLQDDYYTTLPELITDILDQLIFEYGYLEAVLASKLQAVKEAYDDAPIRYISDLSTIVSESKSSGAYVLEVGMVWGTTLNFLLNPQELERQGRISVSDQHFYDEF